MYEENDRWRKITDNTVEYEDSGHELHTISADIVAVCAGPRKEGLDLYEQLLEEGLEEIVQAEIFILDCSSIQ